MKTLASCSLATLLALAAGACGSGTEPTLALPGGGPARAVLTHNEASHNALLADALMADDALRTALAANPLASGAVSAAYAAVVPPNPLPTHFPPAGYTGSATTPADYYKEMTRELMKYVASCALESSAPEDASTLRIKGDAFPGELGLCPDWRDKAPSGLCQQLVSACVLARVNAKGRRVPISVRGPDPGLFPVQKTVAVETTLRDKTLVASTDATCAAGPDATRNCGFEARHVGQCAPGAAVTVCGPDAPIARVCKGIHACDDPDGKDPNPAFKSSPLPYAGVITGINGAKAEGPLPSSCSGGTVFSFACPESGYFSLMLAPTGASPPADDALTFSGATYPAREEEVFTFREGAFYGNLFSPLANNKADDALPGSLHACYGPDWGCGIAQATDRFCAGAGAEVAMACSDDAARSACFGNGNIPEACTPGGTTTAHACSAAPHEGAPDAGWSYYAQCQGFTVAITVYLNQPCDLSDVDANGNCPGSKQ